MGISDAPTWLVLPFAPDANYSAGALPWSGTPTKTTWAGAPSVGFTPKLGVPAQAINYLFNEHAVALIDIKDRLEQIADLFSEASVVFNTSPGTNHLWTCPDNVYRVRLQGCGAGGGGGGGGAGGSGTSNMSQSGSGGGSALEGIVEVDVTPGVVYAINLGVGGTSGAAGSGSGGGDGGNGGNTIFRINGGATLATFKGAMGGLGGGAGWGTSQHPVAYPGGPVSQWRPASADSVPSDGLAVTYCFGPGFGGDGVTTNNDTRKGADSIRHTGGAGGAHGATGGSYKQGAGGGGGAAGPYGNGGDGGAGGNGAVATDGLSGGGGALAGGAGGGGGGAGGYGPSGTTLGGVGGTGGFGKLTLSYVLGNKP